jgi:hypothetical protein
MGVMVKVITFGDMTPWSLVNVYKASARNFCLVMWHSWSSVAKQSTIMSFSLSQLIKPEIRMESTLLIMNRNRMANRTSNKVECWKLAAYPRESRICSLRLYIRWKEMLLNVHRSTESLNLHDVSGQSCPLGTFLFTHGIYYRATSFCLGTFVLFTVEHTG